MSATTGARRSMLNVEVLEARFVPTTLIQLDSLPIQSAPVHMAAGNLVINGSDQADIVRVTTVAVNKEQVIRVSCNGIKSSFPAREVTGRIEFHGRDGNDTFIYGGSKSVHADGGAGKDSIRSGSGNDQLFGGDGDDYLSGGAATTNWTAGMEATSFGVAPGTIGSTCQTVAATIISLVARATII